MPYQVLYAVDTLDTNPSVDLFDTFREAEDFVSDEVRRRVDHIVEHSPFPVSAARPGHRAACSQEIGQLGHRGIGLFAALPCICSRPSYGIGI